MKMKVSKALPLFLIIVTVAAMTASCTFVKKQVAIKRNMEKPLNVSLSSPNFQAGETEAQFDSPFPMAPLRKTGVKIAYFPFEDAVCLQYRIDMINFYQFWDRPGRETFKKALDDYNRDYDAKKLRSNRSGKTRSLYGEAGGFLIWQTGNFTRQLRGNMDMTLGYYFRERSPFFTITQGEAQFEDFTQNEDEVVSYSGERPVFLTRAQAGEIAEAFDQEFLMSLIPDAIRSDMARNQRLRMPVESDSY
jgi:hypothetical protein